MLENEEALRESRAQREEGERERWELVQQIQTMEGKEGELQALLRGKEETIGRVRRGPLD